MSLDEDSFIYGAPQKGFRWVWPTQVAWARARKLQQGVIIGEADSHTEPDPDAARIATIHSRQDLALLISMVGDQHKQLVSISRGVWLIAWCALVATCAVISRG